MIRLFEKYAVRNAARRYKPRPMTTQQYPSRQSIMFHQSKIIIEDCYEPVVWSKQLRYTPDGGDVLRWRIKRLESLSVNSRFTIHPKFLNKNKTSSVGETKANCWIDQKS